MLSDVAIPIWSGAWSRSMTDIVQIIRHSLLWRTCRLPVSVTEGSSRSIAFARKTTSSSHAAVGVSRTALGGIGPHPDDVMHMKRTADRLLGDQFRWSVLGAGRHQLPIAAMTAAMGGNVRVSLEDSLRAGPGKLATSNADQVRLLRKIIEGLGLEIATPDADSTGEVGPDSMAETLRAASPSGGS